MKNLVRRYKIHMVEPCLTIDEIKLSEYLKDLFINLEKFHSPETIYYTDVNDRLIFKYIVKYKWLYTTQYFFKRCHELNYPDSDKQYLDLCSFIKYLITPILNLEIKDCYMSAADFSNLENDLKKIKTQK